SAESGGAGTLLLDPTNIYIAANQGNATAAGMVGADTSAGTGAPDFAASGAVQDSLLDTATLEAALGTNNVTITTANNDGTGEGFIRFVDPVSWASANSLAATADTDIFVAAAITN